MKRYYETFFIEKRRNENKYRRLINAMGITTDSSVIDFGCGDAKILKYVRPASYIGVEPSEVFIRHNIAIWKSKKDFVGDFIHQDLDGFLASLEDRERALEFKGKFDFVLLVDVINMIPQSIEMWKWKYLLDLLSENGLLLVYIPNANNIINRFKYLPLIRSLYNRLLSKNVVTGSMTSTDLVDLFQDRGFKFEYQEYFHHNTKIGYIESLISGAVKQYKGSWVVFKLTKI
jgi:hypothetical protein